MRAFHGLMLRQLEKERRRKERARKWKQLRNEGKWLPIEIWRANR